MDVSALFRREKPEIVRLWAKAVFDALPFATPGFVRTNDDPFANPVAFMTREAADVLYDAVAGEDVPTDGVKGALDAFVKLRAVQDGTPSQGAGVFLLLKPLLRERILPRMLEEGALEAYLEAESRLDSLTLLAFDMYSADRETLARLRVDDIRNKYAQLERWAQRHAARESGSGH
jgi:hypothetical protein